MDRHAASLLSLTCTSSATHLLSVTQLVELIDRRPVEDRVYPTWSMGFRNVSAREVAELQDFEEFARQSVGDDLGAHAAPAFGLLERCRVNTV